MAKYQSMVIEAKNISELVGFSCGDSDLDKFFDDYPNFIKDRLCVGYLIKDPNSGKRLAFFSLIAEYTKFRPLNNYNRIPGILLGQFYINKDYQRRGLGKLLIKQIVLNQHVREIYSKMGVRYIRVDASNERSVKFFKSLNFIVMEAEEAIKPWEQRKRHKLKMILDLKKIF